MNRQQLHRNLMPEPFQHGELLFHESEVALLWRSPLEMRGLFRDSQVTPTCGYHVAAMLSSQELAEAALAALERCGVLVVEVPEMFGEASCEDVAAFLTAQLCDGQSTTASRLSMMEACTDEPQPDFEADSPRFDEEAELLAFINDPASQLGGRF